MFSTILQVPLITNYSFGFLSVLALFLGSFAFWKKGREEHYDEHELIDLSIISILWAIIGARIVYILIHFDQFGLNFLYWLSFWSKPGFHWGGLFGVGLIFFLRYCRKRKWNIYSTLDLAVIGVALSQSLVNLGVFLSASAVGATTTTVLGVAFPGSFEKRHPVGLYAALLWLLVFLLLYWLEGKYRRFIWYQKYKGDALPGFLFFVYVISFGLIGGLISLLSETSMVYSGINIDFSLRMVLVLFGFFGIFFRSGLVTRLGYDGLTAKLKRFK